MLSMAQFLNENFQIRNYQLQQAVYVPEYGTTGIQLSFEYQYLNQDQRLVSTIPVLSLAKNGMIVYEEAKTILLLETGSWQEATIFIPYRQINLLEGTHPAIKLQVKIADLLDYVTEFDLQQPRRYLVDIELLKAGVKEQLKPYDPSPNPKEWAPDPYYSLTTNEGTVPLFRSRVTPNSFELPKAQFTVALLEKEQLHWTFYERDGEKDLLLGTMNNLVAAADYSDVVYGRMFGNMRNVDYKYRQRTQATQAISVYTDPNFVYNKRKGVALTIEYDLAKAAAGKTAKGQFQFFDARGIQLEPMSYLPLEGTPAQDQAIILEQRGTLRYFIPFYSWNTACRSIEFNFLLDQQEQINAAPHLIRKPIEFESLLANAKTEVEHDFEYQGTRGVKVGLSYELSQNLQPATLVIGFSDKNNQKLPYQLYHVMSDDVALNIGQLQRTKNPRPSDRIYYFVPYSDLKGDHLVLSIGIELEAKVNLYKDTIAVVLPSYVNTGVQLELEDDSEHFQANNYGQVLKFAIDVPKFYGNELELRLSVRKNGQPTQDYYLDGAFKKLAANYPLKGDSLKLYVVLPHRKMKRSDRYEVEAAIHSTKRSPSLMSQVFRWEWKPTKELLNRMVQVDLGMYKFERRILQDTTGGEESPWRYSIEAGNEVLFEKMLPKRYVSKLIKENFSPSVYVNREDNITIKLKHIRTKQSIIVWQGDLSKWKLSDYKTEIVDKYPMSKLKLKTSVEEPQ